MYILFCLQGVPARVFALHVMPLKSFGNRGKGLFHLISSMHFSQYAFNRLRCSGLLIKYSLQLRLRLEFHSAQSARSSPIPIL